MNIEIELMIGPFSPFLVLIHVNIDFGREKTVVSLNHVHDCNVLCNVNMLMFLYLCPIGLN